MEFLLAILILISVLLLVISLSEGENANAFVAGVFTFFFIIALYGVYSSTETEYICPIILSEGVGVYNNGDETIVIPPHYKLDETVIKKEYIPITISIRTDSYEIVYDINGVCK